MALVGDDCYFFCTSTCAKGPKCTFRHVDTAKTATIICQHWQMGICTRPMCKFRHGDFEIPSQVSKSEIPCYWESQPSGCTKATCSFKHVKPHPGAEKPTQPEEEPLAEPQPAIVRTKSNQEDFVVPQVKPIVIQPADSEDSNASPAKKMTSTVERENNVPKLKTTGTLKELGNGNEKTATAKKTDEDKATPNTGPPNPAAKKVKKVIVKKKVKKVKPAEGPATPVAKSVTTKTGVKKKKVVKKVVKAKPGTPKATGTVSKAVSKASKQPAPNSAPARLPAKATVAGSGGSVKQRLGATASQVKKKATLVSEKKEDASSGSDSDDSIEKVQVLSLEDMLRRKALESMMKKRAEEGKELMPEAKPAKSSVVKLSSNRVTAPLTLKPAGRPLVPITKRLGTRPQAQEHTRPQRPEGKVPARKRNPRLEMEEPDFERSASSEEEEEEEEIQEDRDEAVKESSESSSSGSDDSSDSEEDSEDSSESEPEVRRVIVDDDGEKAARKRAKASLLSKQRQANAAISERGLHKTVLGRIGKPNAKVENRLLSGALRALGSKPMTKTGKKRIANIEKEEDTMTHVKRPLSIRERLGKPPTKAMGVLERAARLVEATDAGVSSAGEGSPHKVLVKRVKSHSDGEEDEDEEILGVRVKNLDEIRRERMKKVAAAERGGSLSPLRRRLDLSEDEEDKKGRRIIVSGDAVPSTENVTEATEEEKKAKRRPWRSKGPLRYPTSSGMKPLSEGDIRMAVTDEDTQSPPRAVAKDEDKMSAFEGEEVASPFEELKRRALLRQIEKRKQALMTKEVPKGVEKEEEEEEEEEKEEKSDKTHRHKHKHKQRHKHKKSKVERQIYMPPGMKKSVALVHPTTQTEPVKEEEAEETSQTGNQDLDGPVRRPLGKKGPHPMAAVWATGLSLPAKGPGRMKRPEAKSAPADFAGPKKPSQPSLAQRLTLRPTPAPASKSAAVASDLLNPAPDSDGPVTIKSFSEIMAEKRRKRQELLAQKAGGSAPLASANPAPASSPTVSLSASSSPVRSAENKPRVPITPIIFDVASPSKEAGSHHPLVSATRTFPSSHGDSAPSSTADSRPVSQHVRLKVRQDPPPAPAVREPEPSLKKSKKLFKKKKSTDNISRLDSELTSSSSTKSIGLPQETLSISPRKMATHTETSPAASNVNSVQCDFDNGAVDQSTVTRMEIQSPSLPDPVTPSGKSRKSPAVTPAESETPVKKSRLSLDDELNLLEEEEEVVIATQDESIDDLLADIDDLLA